MPELFRGRKDSVLDQVAQALAKYEEANPEAQTSYYRQNSISVRIRVVDPAFSNLSKAERGRRVWPYLRKLPESVRGDITVLLLLAPDEMQESFGNLDFESPLPGKP